MIEGRNVDAVTLLERYLKDWADDSLHVKLAQVFAATNMLQEALSHYQAALRFWLFFILSYNSKIFNYGKQFLHFRINLQNEAAKKGLDRLEKQMKVKL